MGGAAVRVSAHAGVGHRRRDAGCLRGADERGREHHHGHARLPRPDHFRVRHRQEHRRRNRVHQAERHLLHLRERHRRGHPAERDVHRDRERGQRDRRTDGGRPQRRNVDRGRHDVQLPERAADRRRAVERFQGHLDRGDGCRGQRDEPGWQCHDRQRRPGAERPVGEPAASPVVPRSGTCSTLTTNDTLDTFSILSTWTGSATTVQLRFVQQGGGDRHPDLELRRHDAAAVRHDQHQPQRLHDRHAVVQRLHDDADERRDHDRRSALRSSER